MRVTVNMNLETLALKEQGQQLKIDLVKVSDDIISLWMWIDVGDIGVTGYNEGIILHIEPGDREELIALLQEFELPQSKTTYRRG